MVKEDILNYIKNSAWGPLTFLAVKNILLDLSKDIPISNKRLDSVKKYIKIPIKEN